MSSVASWSAVSVYTVGHSTRSLDELVGLLTSFAVTVLVDVRTIPRSRRNPQFGSDVLAAALPERGLRYEHLRVLGGLRKARSDSPNTGWRNKSFRGFADYMMTPRFENGLEELRALVGDSRAALMCAEAVPWRCHRSLLADALTIRGAHVSHILGASQAIEHHLTPFGRARGNTIVYSSDAADGSPYQPSLPGLDGGAADDAAVAHACKHP
jgi:uncharacterized protein (DUF488 family)